MDEEKNLNETDEITAEETEVNESAEAVEEAAEEAVEAAAEAAEESTEEPVEEAVEEAAEEAVEDETEAVEETAEDAEAVEETAEDAEVLEEATEATEEEELSEVDRAVAEALAERDAADAAKKAKSKKTARIVAIVAAAVIVAGGIIGSGFVSRDVSGGIQFNTYGGWLPKSLNKYNRDCVDVTGQTIGDLSKSMGVEVADFLEEFELPADMPASTYEMAAVYMLPTRVYCGMYGTDFATIKELIGIPDKNEAGEDITEETRWRDALDEVPVGKYINDTGDGEALKEFKERYNLGDEVTADTKWKEVRNIVDKANKAERNGTADNTAADDSADAAADNAADAGDNSANTDDNSANTETKE